MVATEEPLHIIDEINELLTVVAEAHAGAGQLDVESDLRAAVVFLAGTRENDKPSAEKERLGGIVSDKNHSWLELVPYSAKRALEAGAGGRIKGAEGFIH